MNMVTNFTQKFFGSKIADGIRVVGKGDGLITMEKRQAGSIEMRTVAAESGVGVNCVLDGQRSKVLVEFNANAKSETWEFAPGSEQECKQVYTHLMRDMKKRAGSWKRTAVLVFGGILCIILFLPTGGGTKVAAASNAGTPELAPAYQLPASLSEETPARKGTVLDVNEMLQLKAGGGLSMKKSGQPFFVFADPNCPFCAELELSLIKVDDSLNPQVLPLGFKPGSRELSAAVLCSPEPETAWRKLLVEGVHPSAQACEQGFKTVDANMALFQSLRLTATPTMISPSGLVVVGSGSPEKIKEVMTQ